MIAYMLEISYLFLFSTAGPTQHFYRGRMSPRKPTRLWCGAPEFRSEAECQVGIHSSIVDLEVEVLPSQIRPNFRGTVAGSQEHLLEEGQKLPVYQKGDGHKATGLAALKFSPTSAIERSLCLLGSMIPYQ